MLAIVSDASRVAQGFISGMEELSLKQVFVAEPGDGRIDSQCTLGNKSLKTVSIHEWVLLCKKKIPRDLTAPQGLEP